MFTRIIKTGNEEYLRIVENYRENGKRKQRVIANLGNIKKLGNKPDSIINGLRKYSKQDFHKVDEMENLSAKMYGAIAVGEKLWKDLELKKILSTGFESIKPQSELEPYIRAMVFNRLCVPKSKLGIFDWLPDVYIQEFNDTNSELTLEEKKRLVNRFYSALDYLIECKSELEKSIYYQCRDLLHLNVDIAFYDVTSTYFEGNGCEEISAFGYNRDGKRGKKQIVIGLVMCGGLPVAHHVFAGNRLDKSTVKEVVADIKNRFELGRFIFVGDRGMVSKEVIAYLEENNLEYVLALRRRRCRESYHAIGIELTEQDKLSSGMYGKEVVGAGDIVASEEWGVASPINRRLMVYCNMFQKEEQDIKRNQKIKKVDKELMKLKDRIASGRLKQPDKIIVAAERILTNKNAKTLYEYKIKEDGSFDFNLKSQVIAMEEQLSGKFVLITNVSDKKFDVKTVLSTYKSLQEVENAFRDLKSFLKLRPIHHRKANRVRGHIFVCVLSFLLEKLLDKKLETANINLTARISLEKLYRIKVVEDNVNGILIQRITKANNIETQILKAVDLSAFPRILKTGNSLSAKLTNS